MSETPAPREPRLNPGPTPTAGQSHRPSPTPSSGFRPCDQDSSCPEEGGALPPLTTGFQSPGLPSLGLPALPRVSPGLVPTQPHVSGDGWPAQWTCSATSCLFN